MTEARELPHPDVADLVLTDVLFALSDPLRLTIVRQLAQGPVEDGCATVGGDIPKSTRSHHLKTLREAGIIRNVPHGRIRFVSLRREDLDSRFPGLLAAVLGAEPDGVADPAASADPALPARPGAGPRP